MYSGYLLVNVSILVRESILHGIVLTVVVVDILFGSTNRSLNHEQWSNSCVCSIVQNWSNVMDQYICINAPLDFVFIFCDYIHSDWKYQHRRPGESDDINGADYDLCFNRYEAVPRRDLGLIAST